MLERSVMNIVFQGAAIAVSILTMQKAGAKMENLIILALAFSCIFMVEILIEKSKMKRKETIVIFTQIIILVMVFLMDMVSFFPLIIVLSLNIIDQFTEGSYFYYLVGVASLLISIIIYPAYESFMFTGIILLLYCYTRYIWERGETARKTVLDQKDELALLNQKLLDNKRLTKTLQYTAALEERNRLAARLHDKIGHGISGSIILLEASRLMLDTNLDKAKAGIDKALNNLRDGVDDIRVSLREERPVRSEIGMNEIHKVLEEFKVNHNMNTIFEHNGNIDLVGLDIWQCIYDNLEESLTNLLKHSNAAEFKLTIQVFQKIIKVEYRDNGKSNQKLEKGLGLEAIEERTIKCGGRCYFEKTEQGFWITNVFTY